MAKTKSEKIADIETQMEQLENQRKRLIQEQKLQERKDRTKRLCKRMGLFESLLPDTITLSEEQFKTFLEKTVTTEPSRRILDGLTAQNTATAMPQATETAAHQHPTRNQTRRNGAEQRHRRGQERGQRRKGNGLMPLPLIIQGRTYIPHECGMCALPRAFCAYRHKRKRRGNTVPPYPLAMRYANNIYIINYNDFAFLNANVNRLRVKSAI